MDKAQRKKYIRLIYTKTLRYFATALVLCAIVAAFYGDRLRFIFALCAAGGVFLAWGWFTYLQMTGFRLPGLKGKPGKQKVPYILRKEKQKVHKPAFAMDNDDFDDDLVDATTVREAEFSKAQVQLARIWSRIICGGLLFLVSFVIQP